MELDMKWWMIVGILIVLFDDRNRGIAYLSWTLGVIWASVRLYLKSTGSM